ncbi:MAG: anhydro-N-acetylmuramic acid kinase [Defluviitaleaceae bacterium]|nr:anhydro-N-acetylmuramic acid kinase [Defluviitaleaceae bacterium]
MIARLQSLAAKDEKLVVGLMSGTSADGIDAALVKISGSCTGMRLEEIAFENYAFPTGIKERIFDLFGHARADEICRMNFLLGELFANAALDIAAKAGVRQIDLIGSHGQTIYHIPENSTLQIGEGAVIAHKTGAVTVSDFRTADMAAGGVGAPLVPYTEFLMYANSDEAVALQNIGGIGNITMIPRGAAASDVVAFDTGPGNMVIDYLTKKITGLEYDAGGEIAARGNADDEIIAQFLRDEFFQKKPPKATGREYFGEAFSERFYARCKQAGLCDEDIIATATAFTAAAIALAIEHFAPCTIHKLIIGGGGAYNPTLIAEIRKHLPHIAALTQEDTGKNSDAKEAIAFAILANETICGNTGNLPQVTGASCGKILGKISI